MFRVVETGTYSILVDRGRPRHRRWGVAVGGAADQASLALGNALLGNPLDALALEVALAGPTLQAESDVACAIFGAAFDLRVGGQRISSNRTFVVAAGDFLQIGIAGKGLRAYLCVAGGFSAREFLGSRSALEPVGRQQLLKSNASLSRLDAERARPGRSVVLDSWDDCPAELFRVLPGSHSAEVASAALFDAVFQVAPQSNRMGLRLDGPAIQRLAGGELLSSPVCPGTIQLTHEGRLIVLGVDAQTIGGYPRVGHVISADLDRLGQLRPGDPVRFQPVTLADADRLRLRRDAWLRQWVVRLQSSRL